MCKDAYGRESMLILQELDEICQQTYIDTARSKHEQFAGDLRILVRDACDSLWIYSYSILAPGYLDR